MSATPADAPRPPAPGWLLVCNDTHRPSLALVVVVGEADFATAPQLKDGLLQALASGRPAVVVDVAGLDFCDLAGLDALHAGLDAAQRAGVLMTVRGMSPQLAWLHATFPRRRVLGCRPRPGRTGSGVLRLAESAVPASGLPEAGGPAS